MTETTLPSAPQSASLTTETRKGGWSITRIALITSLILIGVVVVIFVGGLALALFTTVEQTAYWVQIVRDLFIIVMALEGILIVCAIAALVVQVSRLVNLLKSEVRPILENAEAAAKSVKGTAEFVGNNIAEPVINAGGFIAGVSVLIRELAGLRRAIQPSNHRSETDAPEA